jgi:ferredoxin-NADP reductase
MTSYRTWLIGRESIASATMAFHFAKPAGFGFKPGQAIDLVLLDAPAADAPSARHTFSIVSAPFEDELVFATRMRDSAFKRTLGALPAGSPVAIDGPTGALTLHADHARAALFIAGGIGITPFVSMLRQAAHDGLQRRLTLIYSNRRPEDTAFLAELQQLEREHAAFRLVATMTQAREPSAAWSGNTGPIDAPLIRRAAAPLNAPIYYLAGPPAMVEAMRLTLNDDGVADDDIRSEEFYGY